MASRPQSKVANLRITKSNFISDVNKDLGLKAKAKDFNPKAKAKDLSAKDKAKAMDQGLGSQGQDQGQGLEISRSNVSAVFFTSFLMFMFCECFYVCDYFLS